MWDGLPEAVTSGLSTPFLPSMLALVESSTHASWFCTVARCHLASSSSLSRPALAGGRMRCDQGQDARKFARFLRGECNTPRSLTGIVGARNQAKRGARSDGRTLRRPAILPGDVDDVGFGCGVGAIDAVSRPVDEWPVTLCCFGVLEKRYSRRGLSTPSGSGPQSGPLGDVARILRLSPTNAQVRPRAPCDVRAKPSPTLPLAS